MIDTAPEHLGQVRDHLAAAARSLTAQAPDLPELHATVDGAIQVTTALAELVSALMRQAPAALDRAQVVNEVVADLRAMHGCLITGSRLLAPARDDLRGLVTDGAIDIPTDRPSEPATDLAFHSIVDGLDAEARP